MVKEGETVVDIVASGSFLSYILSDAINSFESRSNINETTNLFFNCEYHYEVTIVIFYSPPTQKIPAGRYLVNPSHCASVHHPIPENTIISIIYLHDRTKGKH